MQAALIVRGAEQRDLAAVHEIVDLSFPLFFRHFAWHSLNSGEGKTLICQNGGEVAGFAKLTEFYIREAKYGCILWLAVHQKHRRKGAALALVQAGTEDLKHGGCERVFASAQRTNGASLGTFAKAGFERAGLGVLWRIFGGHVLQFYGDIWFMPGEVVLMYA
jgi:N-acetylglutamate synthase-like GNAT family acetyltransferase